MYADSAGVWCSRSWTYDAAGNRATEVKTESGVTTNISYVYPTTSNRLDEVRNASTSALLRDPGYRAQLPQEFRTKSSFRNSRLLADC